MSNLGANDTNFAASDAAHSLDADFGERAFFLLNPAFLPVAPRVTSVVPPPLAPPSLIQLMDEPHATHPRLSPDALLRFGGGGGHDATAGGGSATRFSSTLFPRREIEYSYPAPYGFAMRSWIALRSAATCGGWSFSSVSYTHLTLPTICSV